MNKQLLLFLAAIFMIATPRLVGARKWMREDIKKKPQLPLQQEEKVLLEEKVEAPVEANPAEEAPVFLEEQQYYTTMPVYSSYSPYSYAMPNYNIGNTANTLGSTGYLNYNALSNAYATGTNNVNNANLMYGALNTASQTGVGVQSTNSYGTSVNAPSSYALLEEQQYYTMPAYSSYSPYAYAMPNYNIGNTANLLSSTGYINKNALSNSVATGTNNVNNANLMYGDINYLGQEGIGVQTTGSYGTSVNGPSYALLEEQQYYTMPTYSSYATPNYNLGNTANLLSSTGYLNMNALTNSYATGTNNVNNANLMYGALNTASQTGVGVQSTNSYGTSVNAPTSYALLEEQQYYTMPDYSSYAMPSYNIGNTANLLGSTGYINMNALGQSTATGNQNIYNGNLMYGALNTASQSGVGIQSTNSYGTATNLLEEQQYYSMPTSYSSYIPTNSYGNLFNNIYTSGYINKNAISNSAATSDQNILNNNLMYGAYNTASQTGIGIQNTNSYSTAINYLEKDAHATDKAVAEKVHESNQVSEAHRARVEKAGEETKATESRSTEHAKSAEHAHDGADAHATRVLLEEQAIPSYAQPSYAQPSYAQPAYGRPTYSQPSYAQPSYGRPAYAQPSYAQPSYAKPSYAQPSYAKPSYAKPSYAQPNYAQPAYNAPAGRNLNNENTLANINSAGWLNQNGVSNSNVDAKQNVANNNAMYGNYNTATQNGVGAQNTNSYATSANTLNRGQNYALVEEKASE